MSRGGGVRAESRELSAIEKINSEKQDRALNLFIGGNVLLMGGLIITSIGIVLLPVEPITGSTLLAAGKSLLATKASIGIAAGTAMELGGFVPAMIGLRRMRSKKRS